MNYYPTRARSTCRFFKSAICNLQSAILTVVLLTSFFADAQPSPFLIPFQGRLTNPQGVPYTNNQYTVIFNLYDQPVGGTVLWSETHQKVGIINGMVNVFLGSINPALSNVDFSLTRHLGITIDADGNPNTPDPEMVPRQMIIPAFWAKNSEKLAGYDWTQIFKVNSPVGQIPGGKIQNQGIDTGQIANGAVGTAQIASNAVTAAQIAPGTITSNNFAPGQINSTLLAQGAVGTSNLMDGSVTLPKLAARTLQTNVASVGGVAISGSSGNFEAYASTVVANLTVTLSTIGRPVFVGLIGDGSTGGSYIGVYTSANTPPSAQFGITRGNTTICAYNLTGPASTVTAENDQVYIPGSALHMIDLPPGAGTYTYQVVVVPAASSTETMIQYCQLVAFEL